MTQVAKTHRLDDRLVPSDSHEYVATAEMTWDEWLGWEYEHGLTEWVDGVAYVYMSNSALHQRIVTFLVTLLNIFSERAGSGVVQCAPYALKARGGRGGRSGREPDVMYISNAKVVSQQERFMAGPPDIVVEVVSDDSVRRDQNVKLLEYQELGASEYWLVDSRPGEQSADFFVLDAHGRYQPAPVEDGVFRSTVLDGFWLKIDWLFEERPKALAAFRAITAGTDSGA